MIIWGTISISSFTPHYSLLNVYKFLTTFLLCMWMAFFYCYFFVYMFEIYSFIHSVPGILCELGLHPGRLQLRRTDLMSCDRKLPHSCKHGKQRDGIQILTRGIESERRDRRWQAERRRVHRGVVGAGGHCCLVLRTIGGKYLHVTAAGQDRLKVPDWIL